MEQPNLAEWLKIVVIPSLVRSIRTKRHFTASMKNDPPVVIPSLVRSIRTGVAYRTWQDWETGS